MLVLGGSIAVFGVSKTIAVSSVALVISGASMMAVFASVNSLVQLIVTNEMRGRVMSVYNLAFRGGMMVGNLAAGSLVPLISAPLTLAGNGLALVALGCYFLLAQRRVAEL
jgi:MFS family permease